MIMNDVGVLLGGLVQVQTTQNRGLTAEEVAERAVDRIISVGQNSHPAIRDQAHAFREHIQAVVSFYMKEAIKNDRATLAIRLRDAGHPELVKLLEN
jgi:hypothetical protein